MHKPTRRGELLTQTSLNSTLLYKEKKCQNEREEEEEELAEDKLESRKEKSDAGFVTVCDCQSAEQQPAG